MAECVAVKVSGVSRELYVKVGHYVDDERKKLPVFKDSNGKGKPVGTFPRQMIGDYHPRSPRQ